MTFCLTRYTRTMSFHVCHSKFVIEFTDLLRLVSHAALGIALCWAIPYRYHREHSLCRDCRDRKTCTVGSRYYISSSPSFFSWDGLAFKGQYGHRASFPARSAQVRKENAWDGSEDSRMARSTGYSQGARTRGHGRSRHSRMAQYGTMPSS